ncbi:MAG: hypothetical protein K8W52_24510 [Deltaproteobacteria bacterium]|nr:hypothetical protein [Deltaproteobacteria bacterium]
MAAMAPAQRSALAGQASGWAQQVLDVTGTDDANDDASAQQIARVLGPRSPEEIEAIRAAIRANTNGRHSIYEELDRSLSGGNEDEAIAGLSGDPVHAAAAGLVNADGDPARTAEILRGLDPAELAELKQRNPLGTSWITGAVVEGPHRDEVAKLLAGDRAGADASRLGSLLVAPDLETRAMAAKGFDDAEREVADRSDQAVLADFERKPPAEVVAAREAWDAQARVTGGPSWDDMLEERFADGDHGAYLRMQSLSRGDRAGDRAIALREGLRANHQQAIEDALANPDLHSTDPARHAAAEAEQRAVGERARSLDGITQHVLGMLSGDEGAKTGRDVDSQLRDHYAEVAAHHPGFDEPFEAAEYAFNRTAKDAARKANAVDDERAAGEVWKDGVLGTVTQVHRAEAKHDTAKAAALVDGVKSNAELDKFKQEFSERYRTPMIAEPDLAAFEMRAQMARLGGDARPLEDIERGLARDDMDASELRLDNARRYGAKAERREDLELRLQGELLERQHSTALDTHEQLRAWTGGNVGTEEHAREQLDAAEAMLEPRKDVFGVQPRDLKAGVGAQEFDRIDTNLTRSLEVQREEKTRLAARTGKIFATIAKLGALVTAQPELMVAIDALGHLGEMAIKSSIAGEAYDSTADWKSFRGAMVEDAVTLGGAHLLTSAIASGKIGMAGADAIGAAGAGAAGAGAAGAAGASTVAAGEAAKAAESAEAVAKAEATAERTAADVVEHGAKPVTPEPPHAEPAIDNGLAGRGERPAPGTRAETREQYRARRRQERIEEKGIAGRGKRPAPETRAQTREQYKARSGRERAEATVARADQPLENPRPSAAKEGHGHGRHGWQTTDAEQAMRVKSGRYPDDRIGPILRTQRPIGRASRFGSPEAEAEALGRGRKELERKLAKDAKTAAATGAPAPKYVDQAGKPADFGPRVPTNRPGGYGSSQVLRTHPNGQPHLDADGNRVALPDSTPLPNALVVWEYVPSTGKWQPKTYYPEP